MVRYTFMKKLRTCISQQDLQNYIEKKIISCMVSLIEIACSNI